MLAGDEAKGEDGIDAGDDSFHGASVPHSAANSNPKFAGRFPAGPRQDRFVAGNHPADRNLRARFFRHVATGAES